MITPKSTNPAKIASPKIQIKAIPINTENGIHINLSLVN